MAHDHPHGASHAHHRAPHRRSGPLAAGLGPRLAVAAAATALLWLTILWALA